MTSTKGRRQAIGASKGDRTHASRTTGDIARLSSCFVLGFIPLLIQPLHFAHGAQSGYLYRFTEASTSAIWASLEARPVDLPAISEKTPCPTAPASKVPSEGAVLLGDGSFFDVFGAFDELGRVAAKQSNANRRWWQASIRWQPVFLHGEPAVGRVPTLIRGHRIDRVGPIRFAGKSRTSAELRLPGGAGTSDILVRGAGCYALQIEQPGFTRVVVFQVIAASASASPAAAAVSPNTRPSGCGLITAARVALKLFRALNDHDVQGVLDLLAGKNWVWEDFTGLRNGSPGQGVQIFGDKPRLARYLRAVFKRAPHYRVADFAVPQPTQSTGTSLYGNRVAVATVSFHLSSITLNISTGDMIHGYVTSKDPMRCDTRRGGWGFVKVLLGTPQPYA